MTYKTIDFTITRIVDSFVKYNKIGRGSGEARLYVGGMTVRDWSTFFGNFQLKCFFDKKDIEEYLQSVEFEYNNPSQGYKNDIRTYWANYYQELQSFNQRTYFTISPNNDTHNKQGINRYYIKSSDKIYDYLRKIALPNITSLLIQKVLTDNEPQLWFRPYRNDIGNKFANIIADESEKQIENDVAISATDKESIIKARVGQGKYRDLIIEKYKRCIISGVDDERILIASHIKPWVASNNDERINRENGLLLSPTFDKLFDRGFISFRDTGMIMLSNYFADDNFKRIGLKQGKKYNLGVSNEMKGFLEFHREMIFVK